MQIGIIGLPAAGKTTVFQTLTGTDREGRHAGGRAQTRIVSVPDPRLDSLAGLYQPQRVIPATITFVDPELTGLQGVRYVEGLMVLMREVDALAHVVRAFHDPAVPHAQGHIDPVRDVQQLNDDLLLADLTVIDRRRERLEKDLKKGKSRELQEEYGLVQRCQEALEAAQPLRHLGLSEPETQRLRGFGLLTTKPQLLVLNLDDEAIADEQRQVARFTAALHDPDLQVLPLYGKLEQEIAQLAPEEAALFQQELGLPRSGLDRFVQACSTLLGLCSFFTANDKELRAWTVPQGTAALQAAALIHSDLARGFIRAEVIAAAALIASGSLARARETGTLRVEGKDYQVQDGDVLLIRFHV